MLEEDMRMSRGDMMRMGTRTSTGLPIHKIPFRELSRDPNFLAVVANSHKMMNPAEETARFMAQKREERASKKWWEEPQPKWDPITNTFVITNTVVPKKGK